MTKISITALVLLASISLVSCERTSRDIIRDPSSSTGQMVEACNNYRTDSSRFFPVICYKYLDINVVPNN